MLDTIAQTGDTVMSCETPRRMRHGGFSLLELLAAIALLALLAGLAAPSFAHLIRDSRSGSEAQLLLGLLQLARAEALQRNRSVVLCKSATAASCTGSGGWEQGLLIFVDRNGSGSYDASDTLLRAELPLSRHSQISGNSTVASKISFNSLGRSSLSGTITIRPEGRDGERRAIVISGTRSPRSCRPDRVPSDCP